MKKDDNVIQYTIAIIILAAILVAMLFFAGTGNNSVVEEGDTVSVDYTGRLLDGEVFDTSRQDVAIEADIFQPERPYQPLEFVVGAGMLIEGFDKGVLGMEVGEKKRLTIPPEEAYGPIDPARIRVLPLIDNIPATQIIPGTVEMPQFQFNMTFGTNKTVGDTVQWPDSTINLTVDEIGETVNLSYDLHVGDIFRTGELPFNEKVEAVNSTHITLRHDVEVGDVLQFPGPPWNSTVINITKANITVRHNPIPDTSVDTLSGPVQVHFNETAITLDNNFRLAGKTLVFDIEIVSIEKGNINTMP